MTPIDIRMFSKRVISKNLRCNILILHFSERRFLCSSMLFALFIIHLFVLLLVFPLLTLDDSHHCPLNPSFPLLLCNDEEPSSSRSSWPLNHNIQLHLRGLFHYRSHYIRHQIRIRRFNSLRKINRCNSSQKIDIQYLMSYYR